MTFKIQSAYLKILLNFYLQGIQRWMSFSKLTLNPEKTEITVFGLKAQHQNCHLTSLSLY